jgi:hypothetical protein
MSDDRPAPPLWEQSLYGTLSTVVVSNPVVTDYPSLLLEWGTDPQECSQRMIINLPDERLIKLYRAIGCYLRERRQIRIVG